MAGIEFVETNVRMARREITRYGYGHNFIVPAMEYEARLAEIGLGRVAPRVFDKPEMDSARCS